MAPLLVSLHLVLLCQENEYSFHKIFLLDPFDELQIRILSLSASVGVLPHREVPQVIPRPLCFYIFLLIVCSKLQHLRRQRRESVHNFILFYFLPPGEKKKSTEKKV